MLHEKIADEFLERFVALAKSIRVGNPLDEATEMGPLTSTQHRDRVLRMSRSRASEGGEMLTGGRAPDDAALAKGCFVEPTVVRARKMTRPRRQEEVFGPFVTVLTFADDDEALAIANGTDYGLGGGLWTINLPRAHTLGARDQCAAWCGSTATSVVHPGSPFGGVGADPAMAARWASRRCASTRR